MPNIALLDRRRAPRFAVHSSKRYYKDARGRPVFLLGYYQWASIDPATVSHHDGVYYEDMIDNAVTNNLNYVRVQICLPRNLHFETHDGDNPAPFFWNSGSSKYDLTQWDATFWAGLKHHIKYARDRKVFLHIAIFAGTMVGASDGGGETLRWSANFWNVDNQLISYFGDLDGNADDDAADTGEFYDLADFNAGTGVGLYQKKLIDRVAQYCRNQPYVFLQIGNETFGAADLATWNEAVAKYMERKSGLVVTQNSGSGNVAEAGRLWTGIDGRSLHYGDDSADVKETLETGILGQGQPVWIDPDGPALCISGSDEELRAGAWYSLVCGGAGWAGFDWHTAFNAGTYDAGVNTSYKNLADFLDTTLVPFWNMLPNQALVTNTTDNAALSNSDYAVIFVKNAYAETVNLTAYTAHKAKIYNPVTGTYSDEIDVSAAGSAFVFFRPPGFGIDWIIYILPTGAGLVNGTFTMPKLSLDDDFSGGTITDGTDINGRTPDTVNTAAGTWVHSGANSIELDGAGAAKAILATNNATVLVNSANMWAFTQFNDGNADNRVSVIARALYSGTAAQDAYEVALRPNTDQVLLIKYVDTAQTVIETISFAMNLNTDYWCGISVLGTGASQRVRAHAGTTYPPPAIGAESSDSAVDGVTQGALRAGIVHNLRTTAAGRFKRFRVVTSL